VKKSRINIYDFVNYRTFLKTIFEDLKFNNPGISYKSIQESAGYSGKSNHLWQIIEGLTPINNSAIENYGRALLLNSREIVYFKLMFEFEKAKTDEQRDKIIQQMKKSKLFAKAHVNYVNFDDIYSKWYLTILWDIVSLDDFKEDYEWIANKFFNKITPNEIKKGIKKLITSGALFRDNKGILRQTSPDALKLSSDKISITPFLRTLIRKHIKEMLKLAPPAMEFQDFDKRLFYTSTIVLSKEEIDVLKNKITTFITEIENRKPLNSKKEVVYQFSLQFFSNTKNN